MIIGGGVSYGKLIDGRPPVVKQHLDDTPQVQVRQWVGSWRPTNDGSSRSQDIISPAAFDQGSTLSGVDDVRPAQPQEEAQHMHVLIDR
jgi:hypothetical protein